MSKKPCPKEFTNPRRAGMAGVFGVSLFAATVVSLTVVEYDFMLGIGWEPLSDPGGAWPSGLSLGEHGWVMNAAFAISGVLLMFFAAGLRRSVRGGFGAALLFVSGVAMAMMAFETDPIMREGPRSLHGWVHDVSFIVFALSMLAGMFFLWREFRKSPAWKTHSRRTLASGLVAVVCLGLPGVAYYFFIAALLVWLFATALKLWRAPGVSRRMP